MVVDVGDAEGLDGHDSDTQQQLTQQQQRVHPLLGGALLPAAALIGGRGVEGATRLAEAGAVLTGGCWETEGLSVQVFRHRLRQMFLTLSELMP